MGWKCRSGFHKLGPSQYLLSNNGLCGSGKGIERDETRRDQRRECGKWRSENVGGIDFVDSVEGGKRVEILSWRSGKKEKGDLPQVPLKGHGTEWELGGRETKDEDGDPGAVEGNLKSRWVDRLVVERIWNLGSNLPKLRIMTYLWDLLEGKLKVVKRKA